MSKSARLDRLEALLPPDPGPATRLAALARKIRAVPGTHHVAEAAGTAPALLAHALALDGAERVLYVAADQESAHRALEDLTALGAGLPLPSGLGSDTSAGAPPLFIAASETTAYAEARADRRASMARAGALFVAARRLPFRFAVVTARALVRRVVRASTLAEAGFQILSDQEIDVKRLGRALTALGYLRAPVVEDPGTFAVRGGIIDLWPSLAADPFRLELDGDRVEAVKTFDPDSQRTSGSLDGFWVAPAREIIIDDQTEARARRELRSLSDQVELPSVQARQLIEDVSTGRAYFGLEGYFPAFGDLVPLMTYFDPGTPIVMDDPAAVVRAVTDELEAAEKAAALSTGRPHYPLEALYLSSQQMMESLQERPLALVHAVAVTGAAETQPLQSLEIATGEVSRLVISDQRALEQKVRLTRLSDGRASGLDALVEALASWQEAGLSVILVARTRTQAERLAALLRHRSIEVTAPEEIQSSPEPGRVRVVVAPLSRGSVVTTEGFVLLTEEEIFGHRAHRRPEPARPSASGLADLRALSQGDHVVHLEHGIGRYLGLERRVVGGISVDLLVVAYAGGDKLFLPVYRLNQIQKYSGGDATPKLDRLGGQTFSKTKARVAERVRLLADDLLRLYADRQALTRPGLPPLDDSYAAFEASFPHDETRDQASAIAEVIQDLASDRVMDRLVCGDVGFGKTEVALRAAFLSANAGRQVALLCPTTVLAQQHTLTFSSRLAGYPIEVRALSRFQSKTETQKTLLGLRDGTVDIVVGTHRLLSKDVHFRSLGLLVVDEEQRFGVAHKERIKHLKRSVDVLTLSATPIPRTLQLAVGGLRDMSLIQSPPADRRAIRTLTSPIEPELIRQAVERELGRGGQVFYVFNRVEGIHQRAELVRNLVPQARVAVAHGQLSESALERTMLAFIRGDYDVLVATAIVESGLDIPRANTIIVDRADLFGLSQLYQLRGRVGRSSERAYCYLLVPPPSQMSDEARSRLEALERHSALGSGFQVAVLDMEIRGAGDLLGADQSGFVASVGFDLFCRMLEEATHELRGEPIVHEVDPELSVDVEALLPEEYVSEIGVRLSFYKRLSSARDEQEVEELAAELEDRFGAPPREARHLIELMRLKTELRRLHVLGCEATSRSVTLHLRDDTPLDPARIGKLVSDKRSVYRLSPDGRLTRRADEGRAREDGLALADRMLSELADCVAPSS